MSRLVVAEDRASRAVRRDIGTAMTLNLSLQTVRRTAVRISIHRRAVGRTIVT